jgi:cytochrome c
MGEVTKKVSKGTRMKNKWIAAISMVLLVSSMAWAVGEEATVQEMVDKAAQAFQDKGKDYALKLLSASAGPYRRGELFVFAIAFDGVMVAHAANHELVGKNLKDLKDTAGKPFVEEMLDIVRNQGSGWVEYHWTRVGEKDPTVKRSFVKRVPGEDILVGAGYYVK